VAAPIPGSWLYRTLHTVLTHPVVMPLKATVRDVYWSIRGRSIANPPLPASVASVLFVCKGNICRSPFAAALAKRIAGEYGLDGIEWTSAGISASQAARSPEDARTAAADYAITLGDDPPRLLTRELMESNDLIVVMEAGQMAALTTRYPNCTDRIYLLPLAERPLASGQARYHIADPFGRPREAFDDCFRRLDRALRALIAIIGKQGQTGAA
jgi:protein-tyrosine-phosphatase